MNMNEIIDVTLGNKGYLYLVFRSNVCEHCHGITDLIKGICKETDYKFIEINIDENPDIERAYSIEYKPTVLLFKDDKLIDSIVGKRTSDRYIKNICC